MHAEGSDTLHGKENMVQESTKINNHGVVSTEQTD